MGHCSMIALGYSLFSNQASDMFRWGWVNVDAFWKSFYGRSKFKKSLNIYC